MANELISGAIGRQLEQFKPERYRLVDAALDFTIDEARRIKDWPLLEEAVDVKIAEQQKFVAWWRASVTGQGTRTDLSRDRGKGSLPMSQAENQTGMKNQRVSDLGKWLETQETQDRYRIHLLGEAYVAACLEGEHDTRGTLGTGKNEWFTPAEYIELARQVMDGIDLDPATHELAQQIVKASVYYTKEDDGLTHEWHGRVWLNPPYAQPLIAQFVSKMCAERMAGRVTAAIMLTHNYTDTEWFHEAANAAAAVCFTRGRVKFQEPDGGVASPTQGQAFFYFGPGVTRFAEIFESVGFVIYPVHLRPRET